MSSHILSVVRPLPQLKGSLKLTALEMAHLASRSGHVRVSYWTLAKKTGLHLRTMIRHVHRLVSMGILVKQTVRLTLTRYAVNMYRFCVGVDDLHKRSTDKTPQCCPTKGKTFARTREKEHPKSRLPSFLTTLGLTEGSGIWRSVIGGVPSPP